MLTSKNSGTSGGKLQSGKSVNDAKMVEPSRFEVREAGDGLRIDGKREPGRIATSAKDLMLSG